MYSLLLGIALTLCGFVGTLFFDAFWGLVVFSTFTHITPQQLSELYIAPLRIPFLLSITTLVVYLFSNRYPDKFKFRPTEFWLMLMMLMGMALGSFHAFDSEAVLEGTLTFFKFTVFFLLFVNIIDSRYKLTWFLNALMLSCAWMVYRCWDARWLGPRFENLGGGIVNDANQFAAALILMLPLVVDKALRKGDWRIRVAAAIGAFGMIMAIILTGSRAGFLGVGAGFIAFVAFYKQHRKTVILLLLMVAALASYFAPKEYMERISTIFSSEKIEEDDSSQGRLDAWNLAITLWYKNPILGCGMRNFSYYMGFQIEDTGWGERGHVAHSLWFEALGDGGILVFVPLVAMLSLFFFRTTRLKKKFLLEGKTGTHDEIASLQIGMVGFLVSASFVNRLFYEPIYWWCAMAIVHQRISQEPEDGGQRTVDGGQLTVDR